jgi:hypothetical protein
MDELVHHSLRELAFDGDLGKFLSVYVILPVSEWRVRTRLGLGFH